jgi:hypothetical protein
MLYHHGHHILKTILKIIRGRWLVCLSLIYGRDLHGLGLSRCKDGVRGNRILVLGGVGAILRAFLSAVWWKRLDWRSGGMDRRGIWL